MARFDSRDHLDRWKETGRFPAIHDPIALMVRSVMRRGSVICDLGSSTGLLTARLASVGYEAYGIEASPQSVDLGDEYGTYSDRVRVLQLSVTPDQLDCVRDILVTPPPTDAVVARRVLPELHDHGVTPQMLGECLAGTHVQHVFLEGRAPRKGATHELASLDGELAGMTAAGWRVADRDGDVAHLLRA